MCHFITATLPRRAPHEALDAVARDAGRQFRPLVSPGVQAQLPADSAYFLTTHAHCDCGTYLGSTRRAAARAPDWAAEEAKLLGKGWSRTKAARAVAQRRDDGAAKQEADEQAQRTQSGSLEGFVSGILQSGLTPTLGLLLHEYCGPLDEDFTIIRHEQVPRAARLSEALSGAEEDVLYVFHADR